MVGKVRGSRERRCGSKGGKRRRVTGDGCRNVRYGKDGMSVVGTGMEL